MTPQQRRRIPFVGIAIALVAALVYVGVTAMQGGSVISIPLPGTNVTVGAIIVACVGELGRRMLKKLDDVGAGVRAVDEKVERNSGDFKSFRATVETVLMDADGRGGLLNDVRELQSAVFRDGGPAPRGVVAPSSLPFPSQVKAMP